MWPFTSRFGFDLQTIHLWEAVSALFDRWCETGFRPVRLIGMSAGQLSHGSVQMSLFVDPVNERQKKVDAVADRITAKFGANAIRRGGGLP